MEKSRRRALFTVCCLFAVIIFSGCAGPQASLAPPSALTAPTPILDNSGAYMCPYTQDNVLAEWTDKAVNAQMGAQVGKMAGAYAGQRALSAVPFVGGFLGSAVGEQAGKAIAVESAGGMEFIRSSSDISFNSLADMSVYMYVNYSDHEHYNEALSAAMEIYPDLKSEYTPALQRASRN